MYNNTFTLTVLTPKPADKFKLRNEIQSLLFKLQSDKYDYGRVVISINEETSIGSAIRNLADTIREEIRSEIEESISDHRLSNH